MALNVCHCHYLLGFICVCSNNNERDSGAGRSGNIRAALNFNLEPNAAQDFNFFNPQLPTRKAVAFWEGFSDQPHLPICRQWNHLETASLRKKPVVNSKFPHSSHRVVPHLGGRSASISILRCSTFPQTFLICIIFVFSPGQEGSRDKADKLADTLCGFISLLLE